MANKSYHELTEEEWKIVEKALPPEKRTGRPQTDARAAFNGILWILKSGAPWRFLPENKAKQNVEKFLPSIQLFAKCIDTAWERVKMLSNTKQSKILLPRVAVKPLKSMSLLTKNFTLSNSCFLPVT